MKKLLLFIAILVLTITLSGCDAMNPDLSGYYTQEDVDEMLSEQQEDLDEEFIDLREDLQDLFEQLEEDVNIKLAEQAYEKERLYEIVEVTIVEVNEGVYLTETSGFTTEQYVVVTEKIFEIGDKTNVAIYLNGDVRMWNELKEFD
jgi:hypothetical protein